MSYCPNCGDQADEKDKFCSKCGTALKTQAMLKKKSFFQTSFPPKPSTNLMNGFYNRGQCNCTCCRHCCYGPRLTQLTGTSVNSLISQGVIINALQYILSDIVELISLCAAAVVYASSCFSVDLHFTSNYSGTSIRPS